MPKVIEKEVVEILESLFLKAKEAHYQAYIDTDGHHPDWAIWYAEFLFDKLPRILSEEMIRSEIIYNLVLLDKTYTSEAPEIAWSKYYARYFLENYS
jgi:hypothetical protein